VRQGQQQLSEVGDPNVVIPLAASYNSRGLAGFTNTITNAVDQRKINSMYEPVHNSVSGETALYLIKRPGVSDVGSTYGTTGQVAYLWDVAAGALTSAAVNRWVFSTSSNDCRASDASSTTVILTSAGYSPAFVDKSFITSTDTCIVQLRHTNGTQRVFYSSTIGTWTEIIDTDFTTLAHVGKMEYLNGRAYVLSRTGARIYNSDLNSLSSWSATSFLTKQVVQDIATGLARFGDQIIAFGESTMEVFRDVGNPTGSSLEAQTDLAQRVGLQSTVVTGQRHYYTRIGDYMFWRGSNPLGVYAYNGQRVEKVSTPAIDKILAERQHYFVSSMDIQGQKAVVIGLDLPSATTQRALLFFPDWKDWFEWNSTVFIPQSSPRLLDVCLGVGTNQHKLYQVSSGTDNWQDAGGNYTMTHQFKIPKQGNGRDRMSMFGVTGDTSRSAQNLSVEFSNDDYQTFQTVRNIDLTAPEKALWHCGSYKTPRIARLSYAGSLGVRLKDAIARIT